MFENLLKILVCTTTGAVFFIFPRVNIPSPNKNVVTGCGKGEKTSHKKTIKNTNYEKRKSKERKHYVGALIFQ